MRQQNYQENELKFKEKIFFAPRVGKNEKVGIKSRETRHFFGAIFIQKLDNI